MLQPWQQMAQQIVRRLPQAGWLSWQVQEAAAAQCKKMKLDFRLQAGIGKSWHIAAICGWCLVVKGELAVASGGARRHAMAAQARGNKVRWTGLHTARLVIG
jgi:hypothetical protein